MAGTAFKNLKLGSLVLTDADYTTLSGLIDQKVASVGATANKGIEIGGTATAPTVGIKIDPTDTVLSVGANGLKATVPAAVVYSIVKAETADSGFAATYQLAADGVAGGTKIQIPKDLVVESGSVKTVTTADQPYAGAVVGDKYIELVLANSDGQKLYIPANDLVDVYTSGSAQGAQIVVAVDQTTNKITATLSDGSVTNAQLAGNIEQTKLASALSTKIDNGDAAKTAVDGILADAYDGFKTLKALKDAIDEKQDELTFDNAPTSGSDNPVKSGGVFTALGNKADKVTTLTDDTTVSALLTAAGHSFAA